MRAIHWCADVQIETYVVSIATTNSFSLRLRNFTFYHLKCLQNQIFLRMQYSKVLGI